MDIRLRAAELVKQAAEIKARRLAESDLWWWAREISWVQGKRTSVTSEHRWFINHPARANAEYHAALRTLLGDGFQVEPAIGWVYTGYDAMKFECVKVSW